MKNILRLLILFAMLVAPVLAHAQQNLWGSSLRLVPNASTPTNCTANNGMCLWSPGTGRLAFGINNTTYFQILASGAGTWSKSQNTASTTIAYAATLSTDASASNSFFVTMTGNATLANPTNLVSGGTYIWEFTQDAVGSRTLAYGNLFTWSNGIAPSLTTTANAVDMITCLYDGTKLRCVATLNFQ